jgi:AAA+ superfamily predicted ATPase
MEKTCLDSLTQSRQTNQIHHEDRVGVNALIRGLDDVGNAKCHCLVVMCTNRLDAMDPAVQRRAAAVFDFKRPNLDQRVDVLKSYLAGTDLKPTDIATLAQSMGESGARPGFTYSDITERFVPSLIMAAYPNHKITEKLAEKVLSETAPSPSFSL